ncbi:beta-defensin 115 [Mustela nigripes]|uniref:Beta-defensin 115 n=1 Tax=Mustela putorius furo TaxID=9669 RepID=A0A8U0V6Z6_MUSPF|nr:beta-defensin 115 [Mustela putorius furo]XP_058990318.1 beta-defensin 115 [Mustela lutreola]XP_059263662.1 beta-defensin 115 [Mustela nigripes]
MPLDRSSLLSGYIKLSVLTLAVLVLLAQASPDGWVKRCNYRKGRCRQSCKEYERKKERCGGKKICCIPDVKRELPYSVEKQQMTYQAKVRTAERL